MNDVEPAPFDYAQLEPAQRAVATEAAAEIKLHRRRAAESIVAIGRELMRVKAALPHGAYLPWIAAEFGWGDSNAKRFIQVAEFATKTPNLGDFAGQFDVSALYLLARPSTPEPVRQAAVERAAIGQRISHGFVHDLLAETKVKVCELLPPLPRAADPPIDPVARRRFEGAAELGGLLKLFTVAKLDPLEVARAIKPVTRRGYVEEVLAVRAWIDAFLIYLGEISAPTGRGEPASAEHADAAGDADRPLSPLPTSS